MTTVKQAQASGTVPTVPITYQCILYKKVAELFPVNLGTFYSDGPSLDGGNPACNLACASINSTPSSIYDNSCKDFFGVIYYILQGHYTGGNCPLNSTGTTTCTCNTGYVPDSTGTSCILNNYTITLSGGATTEPWNKKHDQYHKAANLPFLAIVTDKNGQPKAGVNVSVSTGVTPYTGGHSQNDGRPKGKLVATQGNPVSAVSTVGGGAAISGVTDKSGVVWFTFGAEEASGEHTITANCTGCKAPATATVKAEIQGLMKLGDDNTCTTSYCLQGGKTLHPDNHYFALAALIQVWKLANAYEKEYGEVLKINDSSLIKGGLYDYQNNWNTPHKGHRKGIVVDINNFSEMDAGFEQFVAKRQAFAKWEGLDVSPTPHYHIRLLGKGMEE
jgi:hypothetical protein